MRLRFTLFFPLVIAVQGIWSTNLANIFGPYVSNGTEFAASSDSDFFQVASGRWSTWQAPKFQAAIKPVTEADVQAIVRLHPFFQPFQVPHYDQFHRVAIFNVETD